MLLLGGGRLGSYLDMHAVIKISVLARRIVCSCNPRYVGECFEWLIEWVG